MRTDALSIETYVREKKIIVDSALEQCLPQPSGQEKKIVESMKYSLSAGGKRLRPILCIASAETVGGNIDDVIQVACALEFIHTYSLIHDDLPVMDDDDLRRGKPTNHKVFGEAAALLAGDALLTEAFNIIARSRAVKTHESSRLLQVIGLIAEAAGYGGMIGGQMSDILWEGKSVDPYLMEYIHTRKTGALITASVLSGAILGGAGDLQCAALRIYGKNIGLAFQIADDILDIEGASELLGKTVGSDEKKKKNTYPLVFGLEKSRAIQSGLIKTAVDALHNFDRKAEPLRGLARYIIERNK